MLNIFFWQPTADYLSILERLPNGKLLIVILNYSIWAFLFLVSILLINRSPINFWILFFCTLTSEIVERLFKSYCFWSRPLFKKRKNLPPGLVSSWYKTGSFPSGHTYKATYFFLLILTSTAMSPPIFLTIVFFLIAFRVLVGFHYPIDILGGIFLGVVTWLVFRYLTLPLPLLDLTAYLFNTLFYYVL